MNEKPIGVFDSGLGGLTAVKQLISELPCENIIYFGDTGRVPYGNRSREILRKYAAQDFQFLLSKGVKMVIAACGTVSSVAPEIGESLVIPYTGVVEPAAHTAVHTTRNKRVGVIATTATIKSGSFSRKLKELEPSLDVYAKDCPLFVPLVENGFIHRDEEVTRLVAQKYLTPLIEAGIDTLILGCTHYPLIAEIIQDIMGPQVTLINSGREAALRTSSILRQNGLLNPRKSEGSREFFVSDTVDNFSSVAEMFLGCNIGANVTHIDIDQL